MPVPPKPNTFALGEIPFSLLVMRRVPPGEQAIPLTVDIPASHFWLAVRIPFSNWTILNLFPIAFERRGFGSPPVVGSLRRQFSIAEYSLGRQRLIRVSRFLANDFSAINKLLPTLHLSLPIPLQHDAVWNAFFESRLPHFFAARIEPRREPVTDSVLIRD